MDRRDESPETEALDAVDVPTEAMPAVASADVPTEALAVADLPERPVGAAVAAGARRAAAGAGAQGGAAIEGRRARARETARRRPNILVVVAIALGAVAVLAGLFLLGTRIPEWTAAPAPEPSPSVEPTPSATPSPEPSTAPPRPTAPAAPGVVEWTALAGGECLDPWVDPWQLEYTVVDCAQPHAAQLTWRGPISEDPAAAYPGEEALAAQVPIVCGGSAAIDLAAAGAYADIVVLAAYPVSAEAWAAGERDWFCFVTRSSLEPLTGSVAPAR